MALKIKQKKVVYFETGLMVYKVEIKSLKSRGKVDSAWNWGGER